MLARIYDPIANHQSLTLDSRLSRLRRRRRVTFVKRHVAMFGPILVAMSVFLLLAAVGVLARVG
ncbi:MAG: hypothetical protein M3082_06795 [Candidatus Dormibacteraeota bacterium]|nr:hypothetical protein [Candidatus Dormibacteraeota bacterium]